MLLMLPRFSSGRGIISLPQEAIATPHLPRLSRVEYFSYPVVVSSEELKLGWLLLTTTYASPEYFGREEGLTAVAVPEPTLEGFWVCVDEVSDGCEDSSDFESSLVLDGFDVSLVDDIVDELLSYSYDSKSHPANENSITNVSNIANSFLVYFIINPSYTFLWWFYRVKNLEYLHCWPS